MRLVDGVDELHLGLEIWNVPHVPHWVGIDHLVDTAGSQSGGFDRRLLELAEPLALENLQLRVGQRWIAQDFPQQIEDLGRMGPAGQLWSTAGDLALFAAFLANGDERVLSAESVLEMRTPAAPGEAADVAAGAAYGLGMQLQHRGDRFLVGHGGSVPGFLAQLTISVEDDVAAVVLTNCTSGPVVSEVAAGSVAEAAGIKAGDVITTVGGQDVSSSSDVVRELSEAGSGASVEIRVTRDRKEVALTAKMPERTRPVARRGGARAI